MQTGDGRWGQHAQRISDGHMWDPPGNGGHDDKAHPPIHPTKYSPGVPQALCGYYLVWAALASELQHAEHVHCEAAGPINPLQKLSLCAHVFGRNTHTAMTSRHQSNLQPLAASAVSNRTSSKMQRTAAATWRKTTEIKHSGPVAPTSSYAKSLCAASCPPIIRLA